MYGDTGPGEFDFSGVKKRRNWKIIWTNTEVNTEFEEQHTNGKHIKNEIHLILSDKWQFIKSEFSRISFLTACCISVDEISNTFIVRSCFPSLPSLNGCCRITSLLHPFQCPLCFYS